MVGLVETPVSVAGTGWGARDVVLVHSVRGETETRSGTYRNSSVPTPTSPDVLPSIQGPGGTKFLHTTNLSVSKEVSTSDPGSKSSHTRRHHYAEICRRL